MSLLADLIASPPSGSAPEEANDDAPPAEARPEPQAAAAEPAPAPLPEPAAAAAAPLPEPEPAPGALIAHRIAVISGPDGELRLLPLEADAAPPDGAAVALVVPVTPGDGDALARMIHARKSR